MKVSMGQSYKSYIHTYVYIYRDRFWYEWDWMADGTRISLTAEWKNGIEWAILHRQRLGWEPESLRAWGSARQSEKLHIHATLSSFSARKLRPHGSIFQWANQRLEPIRPMNFRFHRGCSWFHTYDFDYAQLDHCNTWSTWPILSTVICHSSRIFQIQRRQMTICCDHKLAIRDTQDSPAAKSLASGVFRPNFVVL